jgi:uncharacterized integral membrane protein (TIGR00697 family)
MNVVLWLLFALLNFGLIVLVYKLFGKSGLYAWIAMGTILANIQVMKSIDFDLGFMVIGATLGNIMYGTLFLVTDALGEKYGHKSAKKAVYLGFFSLLAMVVLMRVSIIFEPSVYDEAQGALEVLFLPMTRIVIASIIAYAVSQLLDVYLFQWIKGKTGEKKLWLRNIGSTFVSQFVDSIIFVPIAFLTVSFLPYGYPNDLVFEIFWTTYLIKLVVASLDTPFVYLIKSISPLQD